ncbi:MAG: 3-phosphoshikimate 1-carboxyvinyltransferase [Duncaniella sp.]|nr:3-phosphoshikimate 1-carboxyvinyltransferase [Duncaniella sp.]
MDYRIIPPEGWLEATATLPWSKSVAARQLVINSLAGVTPEAGYGMCDDTVAMADALLALNTASGHVTLNIDGAGTAMRFLTAVAAATPGADVTLTGNDRMLSRPIGPLVDALRSLGADIIYEGADGFPPLHVSGRRLAGGEVDIDATVSSQFVSALMMIAPAMERGLKITLRGEAVSMPYARLTACIMNQAGAETDIYGGDTVEIKPGKYHAAEYHEEADWSSAAPWYSIAALSGGEVTVTSLDGDSQQPDRRLADIFHLIGVNTEFLPDGSALLSAHPDADARIDLDMSPTPDAVPAVAVTCAMLGIPFSLSGTDTLRIKECDRAEALATELRKVGVEISFPSPGTMTWDGRRRPVTELPRFATYGDHRMAMALAPVALYVPGIVIEHPEVVSKSYPDFWKGLAEAGFMIIDADAPMPEGEEADD